MEVLGHILLIQSYKIRSLLIRVLYCQSSVSITGSLLYNAFFYISRRFLVPKIIKELVYAIICGSKGYYL
jgi:hypothetical protein